VARVLASLLVNPQPHLGKIYHVTGPQSENMDFYAQAYSRALGHTVVKKNAAKLTAFQEQQQSGEKKESTCGLE
jgi:uncharacterized protein YbjT (DUF2867 family)